jgi:hypothetical protein
MSRQILGVPTLSARDVPALTGAEEAKAPAPTACKIVLRVKSDLIMMVA